MLSVAASVSEEGTQLPGRYYPTPPHPPASGDNAMLTVAAIVTRMLVSESCGWWLVNGLFLVAKSYFVLVAESPFLVADSVIFGCGIGYFWLRNRFFFGCGSAFFGCGSVSDFGCGTAEIWLRKRRNMVSESDFIRERGEV